MNLFENELGFKVLIRSKQGSSLTSAGKILFEEGHRLLQDTDSMLGRCRAAAAESDETVLIALIAPFAAMAICDAFKAVRPTARFELVTLESWDKDESFARVLSKEIDILEYGYFNKSPLDGIRFLEYDKHRLCCACKPSHPLASQGSIRIEDLEGCDISLCKNGSDVNKLIIDYIDEHALPIRVSKIEYGNAAVMKSCEDNGVFVMSSQQARLFDSLCIVELVPEFWYRHSLAYAEDCKPIVRDFIDFATTYTMDRSGSQR